MDPIEEAQLALEQADKNLLRFTWVLSKVEEVLGITCYTGRLGAATAVVVGFRVPAGPRQMEGRAYDGVLYVPPMVIRMSTSQAKRFFNQAASKLNGRKTPRGGGHGKSKA